MRMQESSPPLQPLRRAPYQGYRIADILEYATETMKTPNCHGTHDNGKLDGVACNLRIMLRTNTLCLRYMLSSPDSDPHNRLKVQGLELKDTMSSPAREDIR
jgi:hypothetical protein